MDELVIEIKHGGLGDHLFHSHIPRLAKETGKYKKVFFSTHSKFRSPEIVDLIWRSNPYIDGFVDKKGINLVIKHSKNTKENMLDIVMKSYGLDDGKTFHEPEIFLPIKKNPKYRDVVIYDPNYVSFVGAVNIKNIINFFKRHSSLNIKQMMLRTYSYPLPSSIETIQASSLLEYCEIIVSCKDFYCLTSGSATLAAALLKPSTVFYGVGQSSIFHHSPQHNYIRASSGFISEYLIALILKVRHFIIGQV